ncbi:MAG: CopD family protein [Alphaproteobacteria bacterium]
MAGMLYLPRLFVYHAGVAVGSPQSELFKLMERRLLRIIVNPAMIATFVLGLAMAGIPGLIDWSRGYMWAKLALAVLGLGTYHGFCARWVKAFAADRNVHSEKFFRRINEIPAVLMVLIIILIVVRPF